MDGYGRIFRRRRPDLCGVPRVGVRLADEVEDGAGPLFRPPGQDQIQNSLAWDPLRHAQDAQRAVRSSTGLPRTGQVVGATRDDGQPGPRYAPVLQDPLPVLADGDDAVRPERRSLELPFALGDGRVRDAWQLVDQRDDGTNGPPAVQVRRVDDARERVHDHDVVGRGIENVPQTWRRPRLLLRARAGQDHLLHFDAARLQAVLEAPVVKVAAGQAARVPDRDEGDAQGQPRTPSRAA